MFYILNFLRCEGSVIKFDNKYKTHCSTVRGSCSSLLNSSFLSDWTPPIPRFFGKLQNT